jgi:murein DD-endopeptidase MepM/ murein hydrolase activator NlpD
LTAFFVWIFKNPIRAGIRFLFYNFVVKFYSFYLRLAKRLGFLNKKLNLVQVMQQKFIHILVVVITSSLIFINLSQKTQAVGLNDKMRKTILSDLISREFEGIDEEDEQFVIESFDREATISSLQESYLNNLAAFKPQMKASFEEEEDEVEMPTIQSGTSLVRRDTAATKITERERKGTVEYIVKSGDLAGTIAESFGVSVSTILWENNLSAYSIIRPGDKLSILPISGLNHSIQRNENLGLIAKKYGVEEDKIIEYNKNINIQALQIGQKLLIPGGKKSTYAPYQPKTYTGFTAIKNIVKSADAQAVVGNRMNWPTSATKITQYYSWRHHGLDIAGPSGTPLYAADSGTVEISGWGTGYGNQIVINHGGGKKTRYAHCSKFYVQVGDKVSKGQTIAAMGSTGWSTGPHVHFEVIINGTKYNPLSYIR